MRDDKSWRETKSKNRTRMKRKGNNEVMAAEDLVEVLHRILKCAVAIVSLDQARFKELKCCSSIWFPFWC